jgi:hypothetical protein
MSSKELVIVETKDKKNLGGRPVFKFTDKDIESIERMAAILTKSQMAGIFGIEANTFRAAERRDPRVFEAYNKGKANAILEVGSNLIEQSRNGVTAATKYFLSHQAGWSENATLIVKDEVIEDIEPLTVEQAASAYQEAIEKL